MIKKFHATYALWQENVPLGIAWNNADRIVFDSERAFARWSDIRPNRSTLSKWCVSVGFEAWLWARRFHAETKTARLEK